MQSTAAASALERYEVIAHQAEELPERANANECVMMLSPNYSGDIIADTNRIDHAKIRRAAKEFKKLRKSLGKDMLTVRVYVPDFYTYFGDWRPYAFTPYFWKDMQSHLTSVDRGDMALRGCLDSISGQSGVTFDIRSARDIADEKTLSHLSFVVKGYDAAGGHIKRLAQRLREEWGGKGSPDVFYAHAVKYATAALAVIESVGENDVLIGVEHSTAVYESLQLLTSRQYPGLCMRWLPKECRQPWCT